MRKVLYGIKNVYYAKLTENNGAITYETPKKLEGATGFSPSPQGEKATFYADDHIYYSKNLNNGYEGDLTLAYVSDDFLKDILGRKVDSNGAIVENKGDKMERFALLFEAEGDPKNRRFVYWDCTTTRPNREFSTTEESLNVGTESITITVAPRSTDDSIGAFLEKSATNETAYNGWFTAVYESDVSL